jgi:hypothetical protein
LLADRSQPQNPSPVQAKSHATMEQLLAQETAGLDLNSQLAYLDKKYKKMQHDIREVERAEVLRAEHLGTDGKAAMVQKKRQLIVDADRVRKAIKDLSNQVHDNSKKAQEAPRQPGRPLAPEPTIHRPIIGGRFSERMAQLHKSGIPNDITNSGEPNNQLQLYVPQNNTDTQDSHMNNGIALPGTIESSTRLGNSSRPNGRRNHSSANGLNPSAMAYVAPVGPEKWSPTGDKPNNTKKQSRAVAIKDPATHAPKDVSKLSPLNPTSPTYEPKAAVHDSSSESNQNENNGVPLPQFDSSATMVEPWLFSGPSPESVEQQKPRELRMHASDESVNTVDFFPNEPQEHSMNRHKYTKPEDPPSHILAKGSSHYRQASQGHQPADSSQEHRVKSIKLHRQMRSADKTHEHRSEFSSSSDTQGKKVAAALAAIVQDLQDSTGNSKEYLAGVAAGIVHKELSEGPNEDYIRGYCAGLVQAVQHLKKHNTKEELSKKQHPRQPEISSRKTSAKDETVDKRPIRPIREMTGQNRSQEQVYNHENDPQPRHHLGTNFRPSLILGNGNPASSQERMPNTSGPPEFPRSVGGQFTQTFGFTPGNKLAGHPPVRDVRSDEAITQAFHAESMRRLKEQISRTGLNNPVNPPPAPVTDTSKHAEKQQGHASAALDPPPMLAQKLQYTNLADSLPQSAATQTYGQAPLAQNTRVSANTGRGLSSMSSWPKSQAEVYHRRWPSNLDGAADEVPEATGYQPAAASRNENQSSAEPQAFAQYQSDPLSPESHDTPKSPRSPQTPQSPQSPKSPKSHKHSPIKTAKLRSLWDNVQQHRRRDGPRHSREAPELSPNSYQRRKEKVRQMFARIEREEDEAIEKYKREHPV